MKSKRKCNDCGSEMVCYKAFTTSTTQKQFFKCECGKRWEVTLGVISMRVKTKHERLFSEYVCNIAHRPQSAS